MMRKNKQKEGLVVVFIVTKFVIENKNLITFNSPWLNDDNREKSNPFLIQEIDYVS